MLISLVRRRPFGECAPNDSVRTGQRKRYGVVAFDQQARLLSLSAKGRIMRPVDGTMGALLLGAALLLPVTYSALAAPADTIKMRQDHMKEFGKSLKTIDEQVKAGKIDKATAGAAA